MNHRLPATRAAVRAVLAAAFALPIAACGGAQKAEPAPVAAPAPVAQPAASPAPAPSAAVAAMQAASGSTVKGVVRFTEVAGKLRVVADFEGLTPNEAHAFHVHEKGDCSSPDAKSAGDHYNPEGHPHGLPDHAARHAGDLGNVTADAQGKAHYEIELDNATLAGHNPVLGRAVIVHAKKDDGGQPAGNAGARIGCGVIVAEPAK